MMRRIFSILGLLFLCSWVTLYFYSPQAQSGTTEPTIEPGFLEPQNLHDERKHFRILSRAEALLNFGKTQAAAKIVEELPAHGTHSMMAQRILTKAYWKTKQYKKIIRLLGKGKNLDPESTLLLGASHLRTHHKTAGLRLLRQLWWSAPHTRWSLSALRVLAHPSNGIYHENNSEIIRHIVPPLDAYKNNEGDFQIESYLLEIIEKAAPGDDLKSEIYHALGVIHLRHQKFDLAVETLKQSHQHSKNSEFERALKLHLGQALRHHGEFADALALFQNVSDGYQDTYAEEALSLAGETAIQYQEYDAAKALFEQQIFENPVGETRQQALWGLGWIAYRQKDYTQAEQFFAALIQDSPFSALAPRVLYWLGRIQEHQGNKNTAVTHLSKLIHLFPVDYYSFLARKRLKALDAPPDFTTSAELPTNSKNTHSEVARILELVDSKMPKRAIEAIEQLLLSERKRLQLGPHDYSLITRLTKQLGQYQLIAMAEEHRRQRFPKTQRDAEEILALYPRMYTYSIIDLAKKERVEPDLLLALVQARSQFNPRLISSTGELGLFQIEQRSSEKLFEEIFPQDNLSTKALLDPEINAVLGSKYVGRLWRALGKSLPLTLAAYHAGPGLLTHWYAQNRDLPLDVFVEELPYHHTQNFVRHVISEMASYRFANHMQQTLERTTSALATKQISKSL
ncbi:MAG: transglycosylase SLT domain-containing protein [Myxococcota bacterium]|nr:transglycosylase SLT domain-containing protein [Myxococcota bacterium]